MVVEKDIVAISIPFSAGVAMAAATLPVGASSWWGAAISCLSLILSGIWFMKGKGTTVSACLLAFCAGVFCLLTASLIPHGKGPSWEFPMRALGSMLDAIEGIGFEGTQTTALVKALLTGQRKDIGNETTAIFREAGASHILALSGLHLGIIYSLMRHSLFWMGHGRIATTLKSLLFIASCTFYALMCGASASIMRALLFIIFNEISHLQPGRRRRPLAVFCAALMVQLVANPNIIRSMGFQLSYLAMFGIMTIFPVLKGWYPQGGPKADPVRRIWEAAALAISCQIFTAPVVWIHFRTFPRFFLITNIISLPLTEGFMIGSVLCLLLSSFGCCPEILKSLTEDIGQALVRVLSTIASIS